MRSEQSGLAGGRPRSIAALALAAAAGRLRRRRRDRRRRQQRKSQTVKLEGKPRGEPDDLQLAALHRQEHGPDFEKATGDHGQVHRGHQRQRRVLRQDAAAARSRANPAAAASSSSPTGWRTRCTSSATCRTSTSRRCRTSRRTCSPSLQHPPFDPNRDLHGAVAERDDRAHRPHGPGARRHLDLRPLRPQVQGQGRHAHRDARHGAAGDEVRGVDLDKATEAATGWTRSTRSRARPTPARSAASPATTTRAT